MDLIQTQKRFTRNSGSLSHKGNSFLHIAMALCKNEFCFRQNADLQLSRSMALVAFYAVAVLHAPPAQQDDASAVSGRLSLSTTKASHSLPSGSWTQVLSCVA